MLKTDLTATLERADVDFDVIDHERTMTAREEAAAIGWPTTHVGKTLIVFTHEGYVRAVIRAADRLDLLKLRLVLACRTARLATEEEVAAAYPMFELGAVPPWGGPGGDRVVIDTRIAAHDAVVLEGGSHEQSIRLKVTDLRVLTAARVADIAD
jgi:Ala-tRNA(Pro) deacylase